MSQTAMAEAFKASGITPHEAVFNLALARFQNNGGTYERALAMLDAAYGKGIEGRVEHAANGHSKVADDSPTHDGETGRAPSADNVAASHVHVVEHNRHKPGHAKRGAIEIASVQPAMAKSAFMSIRLEDGRALGEVRWSEAPILAQRMSRHARILIAAHRYAIPVDPTTPLHEIVPVDEQSNIARMMERLNEL